jgi:hypothetical protein
VLTVYVEVQTHDRVRFFADDAKNSFLQVARHLAGAGGRVTDVIDPYADTMFNFNQLERLRDELDDALGRSWLSSAQRLKTIEVWDAALEAMGMSGYLFFAGD